MAQHRHKRETNARKVPRAALVVAPLAVLATVSAVTLGLLTHDEPAPETLKADSSAVAVDVDRAPVVSRGSQRVALSVGEAARKASDRAESRAESRAEAKAEAAAARKAKQKAAARKAVAATAAAVRSADTKMWATADLNLWSSAEAAAAKVGLLSEGDKVLVTGRERSDRVEVVVKGKARWVSAGYLTAEKPATTASGTGGTCSNGTSVPAGLDASLYKVHQAVCARWPQITDYGTTRSDGEHGQGRAVDIMVSGAVGWEIADYLRANASELGVEYLIYEQKIWSVERGGEGWRSMSDRGSGTANHYDHVHVTVW